MPEKKLEFSVAGKGWADQQKQLNNLLKTLDNLKKAGHDVSKAFKGMDATTGVIKFNKELATSVKSMKGLGKEVQTYLQAFTDQRLKVSQDHLTARLKEQEVYIKMYAKDLKDVNLSTEKRLELENKLATAITKRQVYKGGLAAAQGGAAAGGAGMLGQAAEFLGLGIPAATLGAIGTGIAVAGVLEQFAKVIAGKVSDYYGTRLQGQIAATQPMTRMVSAGWRGALGEEAYKARIGVYGEAGAYQESRMKPELMRQGYFGAAMGARNRFEAVTKDLMAGRLLSAWKELGVAPGTARNLVGQQLWQEGMQGLESGKYAPSIEAYRYLTERAGSFYQMRRLGGGFYGPTETGRTGVLGGAMQQGYTREESERAYLDLIERGGARAVGGGAVPDAVRFQREYGIERAGGILGGLGVAGGFAAGTGGPRATEALGDVLSVAVTKGLNRTEMKLELESFVEASTTAAERMMSRYGGFGDIRGTTMQTAYSMAAMMPAGATTIDTQRVAAAYEGRNAVLAGQTSPYIRARTMAEMMPVFTKNMGASPLSFAAMRMAVDMDVNAITPDNPQVKGFATLSGISPQAMSEQMLRARTAGSRSAMDFLRPGQRQHLEQTAAYVRSLAASAAKAKGGPSGWYRKQFQEAMGEMSVAGTLMGAPGDEYTRGMTATGVFGVAGGTWQPTEAEKSAMQKMMPAAFQPQDATELKLREATAKGELSLMKLVDQQVRDIQAAVVKGGEASEKLSENFGKLGDAARLTKDFASNLDFLVRVLGTGNAQFTQMFKNAGMAAPGGGKAPTTVGVEGGKK